MNYPKAIKASYMRMNDDGRTVAAMDVLAPGIGEIIGGSQREERLDVLDRLYARARHRQGGLSQVPRSQAHRHGLVNVRDAVPFPRTRGTAKY